MPLAAPVMAATRLSDIGFLQIHRPRTLRKQHDHAGEKDAARADPERCGACPHGPRYDGEECSADDDAGLAHGADEGDAGGTAAYRIALRHKILDGGVRA